MAGGSAVYVNVQYVSHTKDGCTLWSNDHVALYTVCEGGSTEASLKNIRFNGLKFKHLLPQIVQY